MSTSREVLSPTTTPSGAYPALHGGKPKKQRYALFEQAMDELGSSWKRYESGWYNKASLGQIPDRIKIRELIDDQWRRLLEMVLEVDNEFGGLVLKRGEDIEVGFFQVGKHHEIDLAPTRPLEEDEYILGTIHGHPTRDYPSTTDCYTFLKYWEQVGIILGSKGTVYLLIKDKDTIKPTLSLDEFDKFYETGQNVRYMARDYKFLLYLGNINKDVLNLEVGEADIKTATFDQLLKGIKGVKTIVQTVKKVKLDQS
jgi:hypothetical protein